MWGKLPPSGKPEILADPGFQAFFVRRQGTKGFKVISPLVASYVGTNMNKQVMEMRDDWAHKIKVRRESKLQAIKRGTVQSSPFMGRPWGKEWEFPKDIPPPDPIPWSQTVRKKQTGRKTVGRLRFQLAATIGLFFFTFLIFESHSPALFPVEQFVSQVMTRDFRFAGMAEWFKSHMGGSPAILPAFTPRQEEVPRMGWSPPVSGKIVLPFDEKRKGILIQTAPHAKVGATAEGWVIFAGVKPGLGKTVIIRHQDNKETWYGCLDKIEVKEKDWVKKGDLIGNVSQAKGQPLLYFAVERNKQFIDPVGVIAFD
jgi:stage IV sporulation protein FA